MNILFELPQILFAATKIYILILNQLSGFIPFSPMKNIFSNSLIMEYLNGISQSFMLSLKCDHPLLCAFPILFSTMKLKLGHTFSQLVHRFNILILKCWPGAVYISKFSQFTKKMGNWNFLKA